MTETDPRSIVIMALDNTLTDLGGEMPEIDAEIVLRWALGYFAEQYSRHFGHAATVNLLTKVARAGVDLAAEELAAPRH